MLQTKTIGHQCAPTFNGTIPCWTDSSTCSSAIASKTKQNENRRTYWRESYIDPPPPGYWMVAAPLLCFLSAFNLVLSSIFSFHRSILLELRPSPTGRMSIARRLWQQGGSSPYQEWHIPSGTNIRVHKYISTLEFTQCPVWLATYLERYVYITSPKISIFIYILTNDYAW